MVIEKLRVNDIFKYELLMYKMLLNMDIDYLELVILYEILMFYFVILS